MGALAIGSAHARPSAQAPIDTSGKFSAQVSVRGGGNLTKLSINFLAISGNSKHFSFCFPTKKNKNRPPRGMRRSTLGTRRFC